MSYIAGAFTATYAPAGGAAVTIGGTREGFRIREVKHVQQVIDDSAGDAPVDGIHQGTEVMVTCDWIEYNYIKAAVYAISTQGQPKSKVGYLLPAMGGALVLTPVTGTPADTLEGTWTFTWAVLESDIETLLSSKLRQGPITFRCYPDPTTGLIYVRT